MSFTHLKRDEDENKLHISHLFNYVSAYYLSDDLVKELVESIEFGIKQAKENCSGILVNLDGEMEIRCNPNDTITLMVPWKHYKIIRDIDE